MVLNPFRSEGEDRLREAHKQQTDYEASMGLAGNPETYQEEQQAIRREVLVELTKWQQDRSDSMQNLFLKLCGYYYDDKNKQLKPIKWDNGHVSIYGAQKLINFIEYADRNVMLGNWGEKNIIKTLRDSLAHPLREYLAINHDELGLKIQHARYVFWLIMNTIEPTYWRAYNDGERRKDRETIKVNELRNPYFQEKKKGVFGIEP